MNLLTEKELKMLLGALREQYGPGYAEDPSVGQLQAKLSIMLQVVSCLTPEKEADEGAGHE